MIAFSKFDNVWKTLKSQLIKNYLIIYGYTVFKYG